MALYSHVTQECSLATVDVKGFAEGRLLLLTIQRDHYLANNCHFKKNA